MKPEAKLFLRARNPKMKLNKWWKKLLKECPFMGYEHGSMKYLSIMGKDTGVKKFPKVN